MKIHQRTNWEKAMRKASLHWTPPKKNKSIASTYSLIKSTCICLLLLYYKFYFDKMLWNCCSCSQGMSLLIRGVQVQTSICIQKLHTKKQKKKKLYILVLCVASRRPFTCAVSSRETSKIDALQTAVDPPFIESFQSVYFEIKWPIIIIIFLVFFLFSLGLHLRRGV